MKYLDVRHGARPASTRGEIPLRIMMIGPYPGSPDKIDGGAASALTYLSHELAGRSEVELIGVRIADSHTGSSIDGAFEWPIVNLPLGRLGLATQYREQRRLFQALVDRFRPDIIHAQGIDLPGYIAVHAKAPSVITVHGILGEETRYGANAKARLRSYLTGVLLERPTVRRATDLISISPYVSQHYGNLFHGRTHEIPNAVAPRYFTVRREPERGRLLFAGRIIRRKGVLDLVRALGRVAKNRLRVVFAGAATEPDYEYKVRQEAIRSGVADRLEFRGLLNESRMLEEFARAEALVLPSYQETAPMVIQQAMATGLAVIATRICGVPYQIREGETGLLYQAGAIDELATLLGRIADDPSLSARLGAAGRNVAERRYHAGRVADATLETYDEMLRNQSARGRDAGAR